MNMKMLKAALAGLVLSVSSFANAGLISFTYDSTVGSGTTMPGVTEGESLNFNLVLDNGGTTVVSQTWDFSDFVSLDVTTSGGYSFSSFGAGSGSFTTDAGGNVVGMSDWRTWQQASGFDSITGDISNAAWWLNGRNNVLRNMENRKGVYDANVSAINMPSSWSVNDASNSVPEPSTLAIFALGMIGLASRRFKKQS